LRTFYLIAVKNRSSNGVTAKEKKVNLTYVFNYIKDKIDFRINLLSDRHTM